MNSDTWNATWSYKMPGDQGNQGSSSPEDSKIKGKFHFPETYHGCPHCEGRINVLCHRCGNIYCHNIEKGAATECPWCQLKFTLGGGGSGEIDLTTRKDRR